MTTTEHKFKIGDWCERNGIRYLVYLIFSNPNDVHVVDKVGKSYSYSSVVVTHLPNCDGWDWKDCEQPKPQYRPFNNAEEFQPYRSTWLSIIGGTERLYRVLAYDDIGLTIIGRYYTYPEALKCLAFNKVDPCGIPIP